jgi:urea transport system permease protein
MKHVFPFKSLFLLLICVLPILAVAQENADVQPQGIATEETSEQQPGDLFQRLVDARSNAEKETLINLIAYSDLPKAQDVLEALQNSELYYTRSDGTLVYSEEHPEGYKITAVVSGEELGVVGRRDVRRLSVTNKLRGVLRGLIAEVSLRSSDEEVRLRAANNLFRSPSAEFLPAIQRALASEKSAKVIDALRLAEAMVKIDLDDQASRLEAIETMRGSLDSELMSVLAGMQLQDSDGNFLEQDEVVRAAAKEVLVEMQSSAQLYKIVENTFFGLSLGSVLLLTAVGLAITFGVMGVINMAHGEMMMLGAYTTYVIQQLMPNHIDISIVVAIPAAFVVSGLVGIAIERGIIRHLYGRPLETLLATFGVSLVLQQAVRSIFSPLNKSVVTPLWMSGSWEINGALSLTYNRLFIIVFSIVVLLGLMLLMKKTYMGLQMRAVTQNRAMANSMGIRSAWVDALTFGLGSGIAGIAGVALSQLTNVGPNLGQNYIIDSFMVVVFGGVGNLFGTFFAAMSLGVANKFLEPFAGAVLAKILVLIFIILFIQWRPRGLFALKGRSVGD